jgi:hypothetical protein
MICGECDIEMEMMRKIGYDAVAPTYDSQPDFICTAIEWRCPECGEYIIEDLEYYER